MVKGNTIQTNIQNNFVGSEPKHAKGSGNVEELTQLVIFKLANEEYAVEINQAREILRMSQITSVPNAPEFIEGVINVRGQVVVVLNLEKRFNLAESEDSEKMHIVLAEIGGNIFGAIVDEVTEVLRIPTKSIEAAPAIISEKIQADYVKGIAVMEDRLLILLDFEKVFEEKGLVEFADVMVKQAEAVHAQRRESVEEKKETEEQHQAKVEKLAKEHFPEEESTLSI